MLRETLRCGRLMVGLEKLLCVIEVCCVPTVKRKALIAVDRWLELENLCHASALVMARMLGKNGEARKVR